MRSKSSASRPAIWAEGSQSPRFDLRSFAEASLHIARDGLSGLFLRCGSSARGLGADVAAGRWRIPAHRLGRSGRYLPSSAQTAAALGAGAEVLEEAARLVMRPQDPAPDAALTAVLRPSPARPLGAHDGRGSRPSQPGDGAEDLSRIRALLHAAGDSQETTTTAAAAEIAPPVTFKRRSVQLGTQAAAVLLGGWLLVLSLPYGMIRAGISHLSGRDLRDLE